MKLLLSLFFLFVFFLKSFSFALSFDRVVYNAFGVSPTGSTVFQSIVFQITGANSLPFVFSQTLSSEDLMTFVSPEEASHLPVFVGAPKIIGRVLNYPNPFRANAGTEIGFQLQIPTLAEPLTVRVYNMLGHKVAEYSVMSHELRNSAGFYRIPFNRSYAAQDLPAGGYFYLIFYNNTQFLGKGKMAILP